MPYRIYDYQCQDCQQIVEEFVDTSTAEELFCPVCASPMKRLISFGAGSVQGEESAWICTVKDVIPKDTKDPTARQFLAEPTRTNLHKWMKANNLRHLCEGEQHANRAMQREREADFERASVENAMRRLQERRRIEV